MKKTVPEETLRVLGFRKIRKAFQCFPKGTWRNAAFDNGRGLFYDPTYHSVELFWANFLSSVSSTPASVEQIMKGEA